MKIGYARVSTQEQCSELQLDALAQAGSEQVFEERISDAAKKTPLVGGVPAYTSGRRHTNRLATGLAGTLAQNESAEYQKGGRHAIGCHGQQS